MPSDQPDKVVTITMVGGLPVPNPDPVEAKKDNQKIRWCADFDFRITIDGYANVQYSQSGGDCAYSAKTGYFNVARTYKYTISANGVDNDPEIVIKP